IATYAPSLHDALPISPGKPHVQLYREIMRQMEHADQVGFDVYSLIEHHFFQEFSTSANPLAMICAVAQKTARIRFRVALHTLPRSEEHTSELQSLRHL